MTLAWILARNTFREAIRDKLLVAVIVFGTVLVTASVVLAPLTLGEEERVVRDLGLSAVSIFTVLLIILVGTGMVFREIQQRTIDTLLTQPVSRSHFILGKFFGLYGSIFVSLAALGAVYLAVVALFGGGIFRGLFVALALTACEAIVVTAVAIFFSSVASPLLSSLFTFLVILAGHFGETLRALAEQSGGVVLSGITTGMYFVLPSLHQFDVRNNILSAVPVSTTQIAGCAAYAILYSAALILATILVFQRRDFD
jgi:ABC-type transport system involved in multi-copper enzyme maturation permease subunit